jgi:hypothetical protein
MSLLWLFRKFVDPIEHRQEELDRQRKREVRPADPSPDDGKRFRCRICEHESPSRAYCPTCLADTMVEIKT